MPSTVTFQRGATLITVNGPEAPTERPLLPQTVMARAADKTVWAYRTSSKRNLRWTIALKCLTQEQREDLENFYVEEAEGTKNTINYVHTDGSSVAAKFGDDGLSFVRHNEALWDATVRLEVRL